MNQVRWEDTVLDILTNLWIQSDSSLRKAITTATHQIDQILEKDAQTARESRDPGRRVLFVPPLGVLFRLEPDGKSVSVIDVWLIRKPKK